MSDSMAASAYRRVSTDEQGGGQQAPDRATRIADKMYALVWVVLALLVGRWTHFPKVILSDERVVRPVLHLAFVGLGINTIMLLYLTVYLPKVKNITDSAAWDVYCPRVVPSMTFVGVITAFLMIRATWPVWGFLAPMVLGLECLGSLFALHFVPWF